jgi:hypothetical protein
MSPKHGIIAEVAELMFIIIGYMLGVFASCMYVHVDSL